MSIPDPLRPYAALAALLLLCGVAGGIAFGGYRLGQASKQAEADRQVAAAGQERDKASKAAADYLAAANACGQVVAEISQETALAKQRSDEWKKAAEIADARASKAADAAAAKLAAAEKALQAAKAKPACRTQLEMALCPEIPLL